jgi:hypothetical protein
MTQEQFNPVDPWHPSGLYLGSGQQYLAADNPSGTAICGGKENWLSGFSTSTSGQTVKEEVQALFARWLGMQHFCVLMGAGASYYSPRH